MSTALVLVNKLPLDRAGLRDAQGDNAPRPRQCNKSAAYSLTTAGGGLRIEKRHRSEKLGMRRICMMQVFADFGLRWEGEGSNFRWGQSLGPKTKQNRTGQYRDDTGMPGQVERKVPEEIPN